MFSLSYPFSTSKATNGRNLTAMSDACAARLWSIMRKITGIIATLPTGKGKQIQRQGRDSGIRASKVFLVFSLFLAQLTFRNEPQSSQKGVD